MSGTPVQPQNSMSYPPNNEGQSDAQSMHQTPAFFLANYRLGKTLGNGSFGKVSLTYLPDPSCRNLSHLTMKMELAAHLLGGVQVKIAEHVLTQHKVAIKILNKRKIKQQDMEEKGQHGRCHT